MGSEISPSAYGIEFRDMVRNLASCHDYYVISEKLGLVPSSPDVDDREHRDAHTRYEAVLPILDELTQSAALAGDVIHALCTGSRSDEGDLAVYEAIANACVVGAVIRLIDKGQLRVVAR
jgi:hypothetical protein